MLRFVKYALAVFRITHLLWHENGPWDIFDWVRAKAGIYVEYNNVPIAVDYNTQPATFWPIISAPDVETIHHTNGSFMAELLSCPLCLSVWLSFMAVLVYRLRIKVVDMLVDWMAISAVPLLLFGWKRGDE